MTGAPPLRTATVADAASLARIQVRCWHHAFADVVFPEDTPTVEQQRAWWEASLRTPLCADAVEVGGEVVAFVAFGPAREPEPGEDVLGEVEALFVDPVAQGSGLGGRLLTWAEDGLRAQGHPAAVLWTLEASLAREFYERRGWSVDRGPVAGHGVLGVCEVRYRKALAG